jgi:hypothetical protein
VPYKKIGNNTTYFYFSSKMKVCVHRSEDAQVCVLGAGGTPALRICYAVVHIFVILIWWILKWNTTLPCAAKYKLDPE